MLLCKAIVGYALEAPRRSERMEGSGKSEDVGGQWNDMTAG
jgi:hypothetical protein